MADYRNRPEPDAEREIVINDRKFWIGVGIYVLIVAAGVAAAYVLGLAF